MYLENSVLDTAVPVKSTLHILGLRAVLVGVLASVIRIRIATQPNVIHASTEKIVGLTSLVAASPTDETVVLTVGTLSNRVEASRELQKAREVE